MYVRMMTSRDLTYSVEVNDKYPPRGSWVSYCTYTLSFFYLVMTSFPQTWRHLPQWWRHSPCCLPSCRRWQGSSRWRTWSPEADRPRTGPTWHDGNPCCTVLLHNTIHLTMYYNNSATWWSREGSELWAPPACRALLPCTIITLLPDVAG